MMGPKQEAQAALFYEFSLDGHVPQDHLLRSIDRFVDLDDIRQYLAEFYSHTGRPSIDPELLIRMLLVGYCFGIRSERRLCEEVHLNLAYRWFCRLDLADPVPNHSTFSKNRHGRFRESELLRHLFEKTVARCIADGLVSGQRLAADASLIEADANKQNSTPKEDWDHSAIDPNDAPRAVKEYLDVLDDAAFGAASEVEPKFTSHSDPASQWTAARKGPAFFSYSTNYLIDTDHSVIVDVEATRSIRQAEVGSVRTMLDRIKDRHDIDPERLIADSAYGSGPMLGWLVDRDIKPHIPVLDKAGRTDGTWSRTDFEWDPENNQYICPEGPAQMMRWAKQKVPGPIDPEGRRLLGLTLEGDEPIWAPKGHSIIYAPNGSGKSTRVAMTGLFSFVASEPEKAVFVSDPKDGELAAQAIPMLHAMGRKVALIDDFGVRPELATYRIELNAFGSTASAYLRYPSLLIYVNEMVSHSLIEEPPDQDMRNFYYRHSPRTLIEFANSVSLKRNPNLATPGAVAALVSDLDMLTTYAEIEAEEGDPALKAAARGVLEMRNHEHFQQHVGEAARALRHFGPGTKLQDAGRDAQISHEDLIREGYVVFLAGPQALMSKLGSYYALHTGGFVQAIYRNIGPLRIIGDEFTNSPLKLMIEAISTVRAFGGEYHLIAQSRSEVLRKYGEHLTQTIEDNSITKQWIGGLGSFTEADRISKAMGNQHALATALSGENGSIKTNTSLSLIKQRHMTAAELMSLPADQAVCHVKGVGFFVHRTLSQANLAPFCFEIAENPLEGGRLTPDPKITLTTPGARS